MLVYTHRILARTSVSPAPRPKSRDNEGEYEEAMRQVELVSMENSSRTRWRSVQLRYHVRNRAREIERKGRGGTAFKFTETSVRLEESQSDITLCAVDKGIHSRSYSLSSCHAL